MFRCSDGADLHGHGFLMGHLGIFAANYILLNLLPTRWLRLKPLAAEKQERFSWEQF